DASLEGSDLLGTAKALAGALERETPDLILFGQQSADGGGACLWAAVAERLRRPVVSQVSELTLGGGSLTGKRQTEYGYDTISAPLPAVVAVADSINTPRYPSLKGIMGAKKKPQETLTADDVGGAEASETSVVATVRAADDPSLAAPLPQPRVDVLAKLVRDEAFDTVLFAQSVLAADIAAGLAVRLDAGLNWGLVDFDGETGRAPQLSDTVYVDVGWSSPVRLAVFRAGAFDPEPVTGTSEVKDAAV